MKRIVIIGLISVLLTACGQSPEDLAIQAQGAATAIATNWTEPPTLTPIATETSAPTPIPLPTETLEPSVTPIPIPDPVGDIFAFDPEIQKSLDWLIDLAKISEPGEAPACEDATYYATYSEEGASPIVVGYSADGENKAGFLYLYLCVEVENADRFLVVFDAKEMTWSMNGVTKWGNYKIIFFRMGFEGNSVGEKIQDFNCRWLPKHATPVWLFPMSREVFERVFYSGNGVMGDWMFSEECDE